MVGVVCCGDGHAGVGGERMNDNSCGGVGSVAVVTGLVMKNVVVLWMRM